MATITIAQARSRAAVTQSRVGVYKSAESILTENIAQQTTTNTYDVFLSHAALDAQIVLGVKGIIQDHGYAVYIDWIDDPTLDRKKSDARNCEHASSANERVQVIVLHDHRKSQHV